MAPEYVMHGKFSVKSDVFSFGVLVLEIVTGHKNNSFLNEMVAEDLLTHAWKSWKAETTSSLIDPTLVMKDGPISLRDMIRCIHIGLLCVQEDAAERPTMASVVLMLSSLSITLALPSEPAFFLQTSMNPEKPLLGEHSSSTNNSSDSKNKYKSSPASIARSGKDSGKLMWQLMWQHKNYKIAAVENALRLSVPHSPNSTDTSAFTLVFPQPHN
ncbi:hypothetical protein OSB04_002161 [Centaurea solstitialis]|uniref:Protein kinase domain-containing protein n=1 Tax=Centaurea solstitialis TaxID=347529 RepID=A0AA38WT19_9ASTR|nr:hypothetical protein OSB04_002161 [Centaurea solstitialis]